MVVATDALGSDRDLISAFIRTFLLEDVLTLSGRSISLCHVSHLGQVPAWVPSRCVEVQG